MGSVEFGLEEEGVVAFVGVHGDMHGVHVSVLKVLDEFGLFLGVEAEIGVDGEDEEPMTGSLAAGEEVLG